MGKEWYYWGSGSGRSSKRGASAETTEIPPSASAGSCTCAFFQSFDFHPFHHFSINQQPQVPSHKSQQDLHKTVPKGAEAKAPRNSLESEDGTASSISKQDNFKIPKNIRIKTSGGSTRGRNLSDVSSEISCVSPAGTKTPTLVARLMGLDLLPDAANSSSSSSSSSLSTPKTQGNHLIKPRHQQQHIQITRHRNSTDSIRSLPETPRLSSARRSDVERHRLSLQINKENTVFGEDFDPPPRFSFSKRKHDENSSSSPRNSARQIIKQVKDSVSRKVGLDITNNVKNRDHQTREELVNQIRFKKYVDESSPGKHSSYSPRLSRFVDDDTKHKKPRTTNTRKPASPKNVAKIEPSSRVLTKPKPQALPEKELQSQKKALVPKCKKASTTNERFRSSRLNKQQESASDMKNKSKRTHSISSNLLLPVKKDPSPPATKIPQKQVSCTQEPKFITQLSSCSRHKYKQEPALTLATGGTNSASTSTAHAADEGPEFHYIVTILSRAGLRKATLPDFQFQWFSLLHPLDPSIFNNLEHHHYPSPNSSVSSSGNVKDCTFTKKTQLGLRCNRRLLFDLVDELLPKILAGPRGHRRAGSSLETVVWKRVRSFRGRKCEVLEDIDGLIEMEEMKEEEEREGLVGEIERRVLETLVNETVTVMVGGGGVSSRK